MYRYKDYLGTLKGYLGNKGRFSILLLGQPGTGKTHLINEVLSNQEMCRESSINKTIFKPASRLNSFGTNDWYNLIKECHNGLLVIDHVEDLSIHGQDLLFEIMETGQGGKFGPEGNKDFEVRVLFTSCNTIKQLKEIDSKLSVRFMTRITQLVLEVAPLYQRQDLVWDNFKKVWDYMWPPEPRKTQSSEYLPNELRYWLDENKTLLQGNFRDLEKIAINWQHWLEVEKSEKIALRKTREGYEAFRSPESTESQIRVFEFQHLETSGKQKLHLILKRRFLRKMKLWATELANGNLDEAANILNASRRTIERW